MACWNTHIETTESKVVVKSGTRDHSYYGKFWVAKITGTDPKWGLKREFVNGKDEARISEDGIYQVFRTCQYAKRDENYFIRVTGNTYAEISKEEAIQHFESIAA